MPWADIAQLAALTATITLALVVLLWLLSIPLRDVSIIDMAFSGIISTLLLIAYWASDAQGMVANTIIILVLVWAARMTIYLVHRNWGHGEDPRYTRLRGWVPAGSPFHWLSLRKVFLLQGVVIWLLTLPLQIAMVTADANEFGLLAAGGVTLWCVGFYFETVGDLQLSRFKANPDNRGTILDSGLWRYTRHPNYFGELCQWWGLFFVALQAPLAWCGLPGVVIYSWLVINVTGQATLDKKLSREKPGYEQYMRQTSGLIPLPKRRG